MSEQPVDMQTILLIEDNPADASMVRERLKDSSGLSSFNLLHAHNLETGIGFLETSDIDIILLDLNLPEVSGVDTIKKIRSIDSNTPLVILTVTQDEPLALEAIKLGAQDYIPKSHMNSVLMPRVLQYAIERVRSERTRKASEEKYRMFVEGATGLAFIMLDVQGNVTHWNAGAERLFGYSEKDVLGKYFSFLFTKSDKKNGRPERELRAAEKNEKGDDDNWVMRADGTKFWASGAVTAVRNDRNQLMGFAKVVRDKTAQKDAKDQLGKLNKTLEERVKRRTKELIRYQDRLRGMAAELNLAEQRERRRLASDLHDYLAQLLVVCRLKLTEGESISNPEALQNIIVEADALLDKALTYTRTLVSQLSPACLFEMGLPAALEWLGGDMKKQGLTVKTSGTNRTLPLPEDQSILLYQCIRELLFNVLKHSGSQEATVGMSIQGKRRLQISVEDKGCGFVENTNKKEEGFSSGFGLFSIRERVEALGGNLNITSIKGEGTQALLTVPLATHHQDTQQRDEPIISKKAVSSRMPNPVSSKIRILLVDDNRMVREGLKQIFSSQRDMTIVGEAHDGKEAVRLCHSLMPDVVLMDLYMPIMDGLEATRKIKQDLPSTTVVGISVHDSPEVARWFQEAGADAFEAKGGPTELLYLIRKFYHYHHTS